MELNRVGKFERRRILNEIDAALIEKYGVNMTDADISREEALTLFFENQSPQKTAETLASQRGLAAVG